MTDNDLVIVTMPGVQQFIGESRSIGDVAASSRIMSKLTRGVVHALPASAQLVFPAADDAGELPNRVAFTVTQDAERVAADVCEAARAVWRGLCRDAITNGDGHDELARSLIDESVGFPAPRWVVVRAGDGYAEQWRIAGEAITARKRLRDFPGFDQRGNDDAHRLRVCSLSGRWAQASVLTTEQARRRVKVRPRDGEVLSAPGVVKRAYAYARNRAPEGGYPSTWSLSTAWFRHDLIKAVPGSQPLRHAVAKLRTSVEAIVKLGVTPGSGRLPGLRVDSGDDLLRWLAGMDGTWLLPQGWDSAELARESGLSVQALDMTCTAGRAAAAGVAAESARAGIRPATTYLAVVAQDADHMGQHLRSAPANRAGQLREWHGAVSTSLVLAASAQRRRLEEDDLMGWTVYAGGDDLLGFVPVRSALAAVEAVNASFRTSVGAVLPGATASVAVVFFHVTWPLQSALAAVRDLLVEAKRSGRPGLGVAALRRGGERVRLVRSLAADPPLATSTTASCLATLVTAMAGGLSGRLAAGLERDRDQLAELSEEGLTRELRRLVRRHSDAQRLAKGDAPKTGSSAGTDTSAKVDVDAVADALIAISGRDARRHLSADASALARFIASEGW